MARWASKLCVALVTCGMVGGCGAPPAGEDTAAVSGGLTSGSGEETGALKDSCAPSVESIERVKSILAIPGDFPSGITPTLDSFVELRGQLYFVVSYTGVHRALWRSDGTPAGTVEVKSFSSLNLLTASSSRLFFRTADDDHGEEVWVSDGTPAGTHILKDVTPGPESSSLGSLSTLGERLVFFRQVTDPKTSTKTSEVWASDGTAPGTERVAKGLPVGAGALSVVGTGASGVLLFQTWEASGMALWKTDGTKAGTTRLKDVGAAGMYPGGSQLTADGRLFFSTVGNDRTEVWTSDGTKAGTRLVHAYVSPTYPPILLGVLGSSLYVADSSTSTQSLVVNRIPVTGGAETPVITIPNAYVTQNGATPFVKGVSSVEGGKKLYFIVSIDDYDGMEPLDSQLWVTDGTSAGTQLLHHPLSLYHDYHSSVYAAADNLAFFSAYEESTTGLEPWVTNGTLEGTRLLQDLTPGQGDSAPSSFFRLGSRVFFASFDDTNGGQLWAAHLRTPCSNLDAQ